MTDSLALEIELLLLVPDVLDVRDMADLVAGLQHTGKVHRLQSKRRVYLNRAAEVSMLSSMVTIRDGCNVHRRSRSCSDATTHSLMLPCMK